MDPSYYGTTQRSRVNQRCFLSTLQPFLLRNEGKRDCDVTHIPSST